MRVRPVPVLAALAAALLLPAGVRGQALDATERAIVEWVDGHTQGAVDLLERLVTINSGTLNPEGVRRVGEVLAAELEAVGLETRWVELPPAMGRGPHLFATNDGDGEGKKILLIGHLDTVFEEDSPFQGFRREGDTAIGPGVGDMKGGDVVIVYALRALEAAGALDDVDVMVAFTGDEEAPGEPVEVTRAPLVEAGRWADVALGFEGGVRDSEGEWGTIARRSASEWRLDVTGRQAHSSGVFSERVGAGAIFEAARILNDFYEEVRGEEYLTFNAGVVLGGTEVTYDAEQVRGTVSGKTNIVPRTAVVHGGIRTISQEQLERAREAMRRVVSRHLPHTDATITFTDGYPAMAPTEGNRALLARLNDVNRALGLDTMQVLDPGRRGAADISFVAPWTDGLAGLGLHGEGSHSPGESVDLGSIPTAVKRAALLIYRLSRERPAA